MNVNASLLTLKIYIQSPNFEYKFIELFIYSKNSLEVMSRRKTVNSRKAAAAGGKTAAQEGSGNDSDSNDVSDKMESGVFIVLKAPRLTKNATARSVRKFLDDFYCMEKLLLPVK